MKTKELRGKPADELSKLLGEKRSDLDKFNFGINLGKNKNSKLGSSIKKDIAKILTLIKEKNGKN
ncbi:50S ribosomal protein L29 [Candidatus Giovannonibacteria bacterium]|nr:50S ribosomal protein L29 [Candidatus Giovannonibacteria bacterium]